MAYATFADPDQYCKLIGPAKFAYAAVYIVRHAYKLVNQRPGHKFINFFLASNNFCNLLITFVNSLDPVQERQNVGPDLDSNCLTL